MKASRREVREEYGRLAAYMPQGQVPEKITCSPEEARRITERFFTLYPNLWSWLQKQKQLFNSGKEPREVVAHPPSDVAPVVGTPGWVRIQIIEAAIEGRTPEEIYTALAMWVPDIDTIHGCLQADQDRIRNARGMLVENRIAYLYGVAAAVNKRDKERKQKAANLPKRCV